MERRHRRVAPGHWLIAVILGAAAAWGARVWLDYHARQSTETAELAYDAGVARHIDPHLAETAEPAVAMAQSILSDAVVAGLAQPDGDGSAGSAARIGEFRSRLELRQASGQKLLVQYRDADRERSAETANAVARALSGWKPGGAPARTAVPEQSAAPAQAPAAAAQPPRPARERQRQQPEGGSKGGADAALSDALRVLAGDMSATQQKVDSLNRATWKPRAHGGQPPSYVDARQQQLLTAQVRTAQTKLSALRVEQAKTKGNATVENSLRRMQGAVSSVWPASRSTRGMRGYARFNAAGVSASRLREERAEFAHAIDVVEKERGAIERMVATVPETRGNGAPAPAADSGSGAGSDLGSSAGAAPLTEKDLGSGASARDSGSPAGANAGSGADSGADASGEGEGESPLRLVRAAGTAAPRPWWPVALAGSCCGLLYLAGAASRSRGEEEEDEIFADESVDRSQRMITPSRPVRPGEMYGNAFEERSEGSAASPPFTGREESRTQRGRLDLSHPEGSGAVLSEPAAGMAERKEPEVQEPASGGEPARAEEAKPLLGGDAGEGADPWVDQMKKTLSETSFGKMFDEPGRTEGEAEGETDGGGMMGPDRLAG